MARYFDMFSKEISKEEYESGFYGDAAIAMNFKMKTYVCN